MLILIIYLIVNFFVFILIFVLLLLLFLLLYVCLIFRLEEGRIVFREGRQPSSFYLILSGMGKFNNSILVLKLMRRLRSQNV